MARSRYPAASLGSNLVKFLPPRRHGRSTCAAARVSGRSRDGEPSAVLRTTAQELESAIPFRIPAFANTDSCPHAASFLQELGRTCSSSLPPRSSSSPPAAHARFGARPLRYSRLASAHSPPTRRDAPFLTFHAVSSSSLLLCSGSLLQPPPHRHLQPPTTTPLRRPSAPAISLTAPPPPPPPPAINLAAAQAPCSNPQIWRNDRRLFHLMQVGPMICQQGEASVGARRH
jgi:hypothetical protein